MSDAPRPYPDTLHGGRYRLDELLGSGGMGLVFRARDTLLDRDVAIKLLADNLAHEEEARERFSREARATAALNHPNVVQVYDVGEEDGRPYLVMEFVDGRSLAERLKQDGPLSPDEVRDVAVGALRGLASAHAAGLLHRDVKPANLLRTPGGSTKVVDFGIARAADAGSLTRTGFVLGTLQYLAPERRRGAEATVQSDLFGLGATLFHVLTGRTIDERDEATIPRRTSPELRRLLDALTADDARSRPDSADAALDLLEGDDRRTAVLPRTTGDDDGVEATRPVSRDTDTAPAARAPDGADAGTGAATLWSDLPSGARRAAAALAAVAVVLLVVVLANLGGAGGQSTPAAEDGASTAASEATANPPPVDVTGDPAADARNLADWLRRRGGGA